MLQTKINIARLPVKPMTKSVQPNVHFCQIYHACFLCVFVSSLSTSVKAITPDTDQYQVDIAIDTKRHRCFRPRGQMEQLLAPLVEEPDMINGSWTQWTCVTGQVDS